MQSSKVRGIGKVGVIGKLRGIGKVGVFGSVVASVMAVSQPGCLRTTAYSCSGDQDCLSNSGAGVCEPVGYCSFDDAGCTGGRRFGEFGGEYAGTCVGGAVLADAGPPPDADPPDAVPPPDARACPESFTPLANGASLGHVYLPVADNSNNWIQQVNNCIAAGGYLSVPDDAAELAGVVALSAANVWLGVSDRGNEGSYVTVLNQAAAFLPWAVGEPSAVSNDDCVLTVAPGDTISASKCADLHSAICECEL